MATPQPAGNAPRQRLALHAPRRIDRPERPPITAGAVILQSEGAEVFYRDVKYLPITALPPEFVSARQ